jgi:heme oxygenase
MKDASYGATTMPHSFSNELYSDIRTEHTKLNKLITSRLPLCLPPYQETPCAYAQGLAVFGVLFERFEEEIIRCITDTRLNLDEDTIQIVDHLNIPGLRRTDRLHQDLAHISFHDNWSRNLLSSPAHFATIARASAAVNTSLSKVKDKPHVLLAYAWAMYLALFNGGRWIRSQLEITKHERTIDETSLLYWSGPPILSFWHFDDTRDGGDIHDKFKRNLEKAAGRLAEHQWVEVKEEAKSVFDLCEKLVLILDEAAEERIRAEEALKGPPYSISGQLWYLWTCGSVIASVWVSVVWLWKDSSPPLLYWYNAAAHMLVGFSMWAWSRYLSPLASAKDGKID